MPPVPATNVLPRMTRLEYLQFEETSEEKHEWHDGEVLAMSGGTYSHAMVISNANRAIGNRLEGGPCELLDSNMRVWLDTARRYVYPDGLVFCGEPAFDQTDGKRTTILNPTLILEGSAIPQRPTTAARSSPPTARSRRCASTCSSSRTGRRWKSTTATTTARGGSTPKRVWMRSPSCAA